MLGISYNSDEALENNLILLYNNELQLGNYTIEVTNIISSNNI